MIARATVVFFCLGVFSALTTAAEPRKPQAVDPKIVSAYRKLGFGYSAPGAKHQLFPALCDGEESAAKWLPSFLYDGLESGILAKLPPVGVPYGLIFIQTTTDDKELEGLKADNNLAILGLRGTHVTDVGLKKIKEMKGLTALDLYGCMGVTDAGLTSLKELKQLRALDLSHTLTSDDGLKELKDLQDLEVLYLRTRSWANSDCFTIVACVGCAYNRPVRATP